MDQYEFNIHATTFLSKVNQNVVIDRFRVNSNLVLVKIVLGLNVVDKSCC